MKYLVGEIAEVLYWHQIDEDGVNEFYDDNFTKTRLYKTICGKEFGTTPYTEVPIYSSLKRCPICK